MGVWTPALEALEVTFIGPQPQSSPGVGRAAQSLRLRLADGFDLVRGRRDRLTPPRRLRGFVGDSDFQITGQQLVDQLRHCAALAPADRVLDLGCGIGRLARVLVGVLRPPGSYEGFDVVREAITWCGRHYRDTPARFRFAHADVQNNLYNPQGTIAAADFRFPYSDGSFDLVIATSVFTHLLEPAADTYLSEAARVMAPGGRMFATWFLLAPDRQRTGFTATAGPEAVADPAQPEAAVAYQETWLRERLATHSLRLREPIHWGQRSEGPEAKVHDIVVATK